MNFDEFGYFHILVRVGKNYANSDLRKKLRKQNLRKFVVKFTQITQIYEILLGNCLASATGGAGVPLQGLFPSRKGGGDAPSNCPKHATRNRATHIPENLRKLR